MYGGAIGFEDFPLQRSRSTQRSSTRSHPKSIQHTHHHHDNEIWQGSICIKKCRDEAQVRKRLLLWGQKRNAGGYEMCALMRTGRQKVESGASLRGRHPGRPIRRWKESSRGKTFPTRLFPRPAYKGLLPAKASCVCALGVRCFSKKFQPCFSFYFLCFDSHGLALSTAGWRRRAKMLRGVGARRKTQSFWSWPSCCRCRRPSPVNWTKRPSSASPPATSKWDTSFQMVSMRLYAFDLFFH